MTVNYFDTHQIAKLYARSRPYLHAVVTERIRSFFASGLPFRSALDVGCGTGQSSIALTGLAERIVGSDISEPMLREADTHPGAEYVATSAEVLPFADGILDLFAVGLALHWFDRGLFFREARRVLRPTGWLVVYNIWFTHEMEENPTFREWFEGDFLVRYPYPPRDRGPVTDAACRQHGFPLVQAEEIQTRARMTCESSTDFLLSQSNVIAKRSQDTADFSRARSWLESSSPPLFRTHKGTFSFAGFICYLQESRCDGSVQ